MAQRPQRAPAPSRPRPTRRRDAEATKQAILDAARQAFGRASYDQVGLREIAAIAEIDVALVGRYFGSKEELFVAAISRPTPPAPSFPQNRKDFGEWVVRHVFSKAHDGPEVAIRLLIFHHSVTNPRAAAIVRQLLTERFIRPVGKWLGGKDGELRASLILAHLTGFNMMREIIKVDTLIRADRARLAALLAPALQAYVSTDPP